MYTNKDNDIWKDSAALIKADFRPTHDWYSPQAIRQYRGLTIVFDSYFHTALSGAHSYVRFCTRVCVNYKSQSNFQFKLSKTNILNFLRTWFLSKVIKTGDKAFDRQFSLNTNDIYLLKSLLESAKIRDLIKSLSEVNLEIGDMQGIWGDKLPDDCWELSYYCTGRTIENAELLILNELFEKLIDKLFELGVLKTYR